MYVRVPYVYKKEIKKKFERTPNPYRYIAWENINIPEISSSNAEIVVRAKCIKFKGQIAHNPDAELTEYNWRSTPSGLVTELQLQYQQDDQNQEVIYDHINKGNIEEILQGWANCDHNNYGHRSSVQLFDPNNLVYGAASRSIKEEDIRTLVESSQEVERRNLRARLQGAAFIDDQLFISSPGPRWYVNGENIYGRNPNIGFSVECKLISDVHNLSNNAQLSLFYPEDRLLALKATKAMYISCTNHYRARETGVYTAGEFEVLNPGIWEKYRDTNKNADIIRVANDVLQLVGRDIQYKNKTIIKILTELRDYALTAGSAMNQFSAKDLCTTIISAVKEFKLATEQENRLFPNDLNDDVKEIEELAVYCKHILEEIENKKVEINHKLEILDGGVDIDPNDFVIGDFDIDEVLSNSLNGM